MKFTRGQGKLKLRDRLDGFFAHNLTFLLHRRGLSTTDLAQRLDECPRRIRRLAAGDTLPHYDEIPVIARALKVEPADLAWCPPDELRARISTPKKEALR